MSVAMWVTFALCVGVAAGFAIGRGVSRDTDTFTISSLRDALSDTQEQLTEAWFAKAEAVAAQEAAEEQLKQAHERKSLAGRRAWVTRKAHEEAERAKRIFFGDPDATDAPTGVMYVSDAGAVDPIAEVSRAS